MIIEIYNQKNECNALFVIQKLVFLQIMNFNRIAILIRLIKASLVNKTE